MKIINPYKLFIDESVQIGDGFVQADGEKDNSVKPAKRQYVKAEKKKMKLFISEGLEKILKGIVKTGDFQSKAVSNYILNIDNGDEPNEFELSYVDLNKDKEDEVTFMPAQRAFRIMSWENNEQADVESDKNSPLWTAAGRQPLGIGKFINKLSNDKFTDVAIDNFVKTYKAEISSTLIYDRFKLVSGEEIRFWYAESNYSRENLGGGQNAGGLLGSCMRYDGKNGDKNTQNYLNIYCENTEDAITKPTQGSCHLLILTDGNKKLIGRAIVWKNLRKPIGETFMDRIYTIKQSDVELFKKYATEQKWLYKYNQAANDSTYVQNGNRIEKALAISLKEKEYRHYPYMDTLKYYTPASGRLGSTAGYEIEGFRRYKLESTGGGANGV